MSVVSRELIKYYVSPGQFYIASNSGPIMINNIASGVLVWFVTNHSLIRETATGELRC